MTPEELNAELKYYAENKKFSSDKINIGLVATQEVHKKPFQKPLLPLCQEDIDDLAKGKTVPNQQLLSAQKLICRTPEIPETPIFESSEWCREQ